MGPDSLIYVAIAVFALMFVGLGLTYKEFHEGAPKKQEDGEEELVESPHSNVDET